MNNQHIAYYSKADVQPSVSIIYSYLNFSETNCVSTKPVNKHPSNKQNAPVKGNKKRTLGIKV